MTASPRTLLADRVPELVDTTRFEILDPQGSAADGIVEARFRLVGPTGIIAEFTETVTFDAEVVDSSGTQQESEDCWTSVARLFAIAAGTSYYKVAAPPELVVAFPVDPDVFAWAKALYDSGLREFAARNDLPVPLQQTWTSNVVESGESTMPTERRLRPLVPVGGGKDSALVLSVLGPRATAFTVNPTGAQQRVADAASVPLHRARRTLDPALREWNNRGALNGHIPVTAVVTMISALAAIRLGCDDIVLGNERSASEPTRWVDGVPVNHQWAKSIEAEDLTAAALGAATGGRLRTFSILRPFSEVAIAAGLVEDRAQLDAFLSCNEAFTVWRATEQREEQTWCLRCPKCRFTTLMLAPHLGPERVAEVFGGRPFDDAEQAPGYAALWDLESKPYECVGEMVESAAVMADLSDSEEWRSAVVVRETGASAAAFAAERDASVDALMTPSADHRVPEPYLAWMLDRLGPPETPDAPR